MALPFDFTAPDIEATRKGARPHEFEPDIFTEVETPIDLEDED